MKSERDRTRTREILDTVYFDASHLNEMVLVRIDQNDTGFDAIVAFGHDRGLIAEALKRDLLSYPGYEYVLYEPTKEKGVRMGDVVLSPDEL